MDLNLPLAPRLYVHMHETGSPLSRLPTADAAGRKVFITIWRLARISLDASRRLDCTAKRRRGREQRYGVQLSQVSQDGAVPRDGIQVRISYSAGVKGVRVTKRANGKVQTTLSAPGTGLRYTKTTPGKRRTTSSRQPARRMREAPFLLTK
jgi:hypothetical protein